MEFLPLSCNLQCRVEYLRTVPASVFLPQPDVDSAFVRLTPRAPNELPDHDPKLLFSRSSAADFRNDENSSENCSRSRSRDWPRAARQIGVSVAARAEELSLEQWIALSNLVQPATLRTVGTDPAEQFAVVDEMDRVIGAAPRREVHGNNLRHRAVHIFIFNREGRAAFAKAFALERPASAMLWDSSAAGHVEAGEEYDATAARELREELGVTADLTRVANLPASERTGQEFIWLYRGEGSGPFAPARAEIDAGAILPAGRGRALDRGTAGRFRARLHRMLARLLEEQRAA